MAGTWKRKSGLLVDGARKSLVPDLYKMIIKIEKEKVVFIS